MKYLFWFFSVFAFAAYISGTLVDPDLWWHLAVGRWILSTGQVPHFDFWNAFAYGKPWIAYSWLFEIFAAKAELIGDIKGLYLLKLTLAVLLAFSLVSILSRLADDWFFGTLLGIFTALGCQSHFTLRPQVLVWILFAFLLYALEDISRNGLQRGQKVRIVLIFALWANLHISTVLGLLLIPFWLFTASEPRLGWRVLLWGFLGSLITPYLGAEWLTFLSKSSHPFQYAAIAEFKPATILEFSSAFFLLSFALVATFFHYRPEAVEPPRLIVLFVFSLAGLAVVKFLPFALIVSAAVLALYWKRERWASVAFGNVGLGIEKLRGLIESMPREGFTFLMICWAVVSLYGDLRNPVSYSLVPVKAFDYLQANDLPLPLLSTFGNGGYAIHRLSDEAGFMPSPAHLASIDGRTNVVPHEVWDKFIAAYEGKANWRDYLELVSPQTILWRNESPLNNLLVQGGDWCAVYRDGRDNLGFTIYIRKDTYQARYSTLHSPNC